MSIKHLNKAFEANIQQSSLKFILVALADYANEVGEAYPTTETLCEKTALNRKTVLAGLTKLAELGFITDTLQRKGRTKQVRVWHINDTENGTLKASQKRNSTENGTVPFLPANDTENGTLKASQKRDIEPSILLTTNEPSVYTKTRFKKPTLEEAEQYIQEKGFTFTAEEFIDANDAKGWLVGKTKTPMRDWKAVMRTWQRNRYETRKQSDKQNDYLDELARA